MTDLQWNPEDYLLDFPDIPPYEGPLTEMAVPSKALKVKTFLVVEVLPEARKCLNIGAQLAALMLTLAAVDHMAGFYAGRQSTHSDFKDFLGRYFPKQYQPYLDAIYDQIRSGLIHNLAISNPWKGQGIPFLIHPDSEKHLTPDDEGRIIFSVSYFLEDTRRAWWMYQYDIIMKGAEYAELVAKFNRRFNKLDGRGAFMERLPD